VLDLEEAELPPAVVLERVEVAVDLGGDAADDAVPAPGEEVLRLPVLEERVLGAVEEPLAVGDDRRDPVLLAAVQPERELDERIELLARLHRADRDRHGRGTLTQRRPAAGVLSLD